MIWYATAGVWVLLAVLSILFVKVTQKLPPQPNDKETE